MRSAGDEAFTIAMEWLILIGLGVIVAASGVTRLIVMAFDNTWKERDDAVDR